MSGPTATIRAPILPAVLLGVAAALSALGLWWFGYEAGFAPFPPFDLADEVIRLTPGDVAVWAIANLQFNAGRLALLGGLLAWIAAGALFGLLLRQAPGARTGALAGLAVVPLCLLLAYTNEQASGRAAGIGLGFWFACTLLVPFALAGHWVERLTIDERERATTDGPWLEVAGDQARRDVLKQATGGVLVLGLGGWFAGLLARDSGIGGVETSDGVALASARDSLEVGTETSEEPLPTPVPAVDDLPEFTAPAGVRARNTPNEDFYTVDISTRDPAISEKSWTLLVRGMVEQQLAITYRDLLSMPAVEMDGTLMCISFTYDNDLISSTRWTGVPLRDVLQMAGIADGAVELVLKGGGGYSDSISIEQALDARTLLAYGMNGETLPRGHGFPCRLYVPNIYGEKNVKWLEEIELVDYDYHGYWQERGWSDAAVINTISVIDTPRGEVTPNERGIVEVGGIAFAGSRGVKSVRLMVDGGDWVEATLEPYVPELVWQRWFYEWPAEPGEYTLSVQAIDGTDAAQETAERDPYPDGMTGLHEVQVRVL